MTPSPSADSVSGMAWMTLVFSGIAAIGGVLAFAVASKPFLAIVQSRHQREDAILQSYAGMFSRLYGFVMNDLDDDGHVRSERASVFAEIAGHLMYLHCGSEDEAWRRYRDTQEI